jgi:broad specificity phosphatase PhoE
MPEDFSMLIYLIRHALPDWTRTDIPYHLPPGPPLTSQGIQEAGQLAHFLKGVGVRRLFSSPLERALHTTQIVAQVTGAPYEINPGLIEWQPDDTEETVRQRIWPVFELASQISQVEGSVGLITHGGPIGVLLLALGLSAEALNAQRVFDHRNPVPTAGAWQALQNGMPESWSLRLVFQPGPVELDI